jgi:hypothetical protein
MKFIPHTFDSCGRRIQRNDSIHSTGGAGPACNAGRSTAGRGGLISYGYDIFDQLTSAVKTNGPNPAADKAYNFQYQYDLVGNRKHEDRGLLDLDGAFNTLNQLTGLRFGGKLDIYGSVAGTNGPFSVKIDGENATIFSGTNFWGGGRVKPGLITNSIVSTDASTNRTIQLRKAIFPPENPQKICWDKNGNLTNDQQRAYFWNEENKLKAIEGIASSGQRYRSEYLYDAQSRLRGFGVESVHSTNGTGIRGRVCTFDKRNEQQKKN